MDSSIEFKEVIEITIEFCWVAEKGTEVEEQKDGNKSSGSVALSLSSASFNHSLDILRATIRPKQHHWIYWNLLLCFWETVHKCVMN